MKKIPELKVIAFDADDTLWVNEPYFQEIESKFCEMLEVYHPQHTVSRELLATEIKNLEHYGYGIKSFILSMIEAAIWSRNFRYTGLLMSVPSVWPPPRCISAIIHQCASRIRKNLGKLQDAKLVSWMNRCSRWCLIPLAQT